MKQLGNNIAVAAILTNLNAAQGRAIVERRLAYLRSVGEDARNTAAWNDACDELAQLERGFAIRTWHLRRAAA